MTDVKDIVFLASDVEKENDSNAPVGTIIQFTEKGEVVNKKADDVYYESYIMSDDDFEESDELAVDEDGIYDPDAIEEDEEPSSKEPEIIDLGDEDITDDDFEESDEKAIDEDGIYDPDAVEEDEEPKAPETVPVIEDDTLLEDESNEEAEVVEEAEIVDDEPEIIEDVIEEPETIEEIVEEPEIVEEAVEEPIIAPIIEEDNSIKFTVPMIREYVSSMIGESHPVATENKDANGENGPVSNNVGVCNMALTYGKDLVSSMLIRLDKESAEKYMALHSVEESKFAGSGDYYKLTVNDKSYNQESELWEILEASYAYIISKYFKVDEDGQYIAIEEPEISEDEKELADIKEMTLKESLAIAATVEVPTHFSKKAIANSLRDRHENNVEINERENRTTNGLLPLADTHYTYDKDNSKKKVCFTYVYEQENGSVLLLIKTTKPHIKSLKNAHPNVVNFSKFPKTKENDWYSVVLDDSFTQKDVDEMYDEIIGTISGTKAIEEPEFKEMTLKESLAIAAEQAIKVDFSKKFIANDLKSRYGDSLEINERENRTANGLLPLADTHYAYDKDNSKKKVCFTYVYEQENGSVLLLIKTTKEHAKQLSKDHKGLVNFSKFPKTKENDWYSIVLNDSFSLKDIQEIYDTIISNISGNKSINTIELTSNEPGVKLIDQEPKNKKDLDDNNSLKKSSMLNPNADDALATAVASDVKEKPKKAAKMKKVTVIDENSLWSVATITTNKDKKDNKVKKEDLDSTKKDNSTKTSNAKKPVNKAEVVSQKQTKKVENNKSTKETNVDNNETKVKSKTNVKTAKVITDLPKEEKVEKSKQKEIKKEIMAEKDAKEKVLVAGDDSIPHGKFVIKCTDKGNYVYKLFSSNKRVVAIGAEQYAALPSAKAGIQSVIKNSMNPDLPVEDLTLKKPVEQKCPKWVIYADKKGEIRFRLIASNGNIVATTNDGYLSKEACKKGIDAIARACTGCEIVRNDDLW